MGEFLVGQEGWFPVFLDFVGSRPDREFCKNHTVDRITVKCVIKVPL